MYNPLTLAWQLILMLISFIRPFQVLFLFSVRMHICSEHTKWKKNHKQNILKPTEIEV